jgi:hemerythrin-like domain-containing protein
LQSPLTTPAPDFSQPLDLLSACHRRIGDFTGMLLKLPDHLRQHGTDAEAIQAAERALKYFDTAGQHHHDDEEENLFPMLRDAATRQGNAEILVLLDDLLAQHVEMNQSWQALRPLLQDLAQGKTIFVESLPVQQFANLYRRHIPLEENFILPFAERTLTPSQIAALGKAMAHRRGVATTP